MSTVEHHREREGIIRLIDRTADTQKWSDVSLLDEQIAVWRKLSLNFHRAKNFHESKLGLAGIAAPEEEKSLAQERGQAGNWYDTVVQKIMKTTKDLLADHPNADDILPFPDPNNLRRF